MDFISLHERVIEDNNLFDFLLDIFPCEKRKLKRTEEYTLDMDHLVLVTHGIVAKKTQYIDSGTAVYSLLMHGSIIWPTNHEEKLILENEHNAEVAILNKDEVFDKLDRDGLLVHLLLEQLAQKHTEYRFQSNILISRKSRIVATILHLATLNQKIYGFNKPIIPYNVRFTKLASYGNCSRSLVAKTIKELETHHVIKQNDKKMEIASQKDVHKLINIGG